MPASSAKTDIIVRGLLLLLERARLITTIAVLCCALNARSAGAPLATCASEVPPSEQLGELFRNVQLKGIFPDSKTFADLHFDESPNAILADYEARKVESGFDLGAFVHQHFSLPTEGPTVHPASPGEPIDTYITWLWDVLRHQSDEISGHSSVLPLPYPYVVPGGRFRELYYWDSYFTMLGRPPRPRAQHAQGFRLRDRLLRTRAQRESDLLSQPLSTAFSFVNRGPDL